jgi:hypothetical protein
MGALPNLLVIGAMKTGTSSLHRYLNLHGDIAMSDRKEINFFVRQGSWNRGVPWYETHFDPDSPIRGESSPSYSHFPYVRDAPTRAAELIPHAKIIYLVRDPISRFVSHYVHRVAAGREARSFDEVVRAAASESADADEVDSLLAVPGYRTRGLYALQLEQWLPRFPIEQILVVDQSELGERRAGALGKIAAFLGVPNQFPRSIDEVHNSSETKRRPSRFGTTMRWVGRTSGAKKLLPDSARAALIGSRTFTRAFDRPTLSQSTREHLVSMFSEDVERLRALTGQAFADWSL